MTKRHPGCTTDGVAAASGAAIRRTLCDPALFQRSSTPASLIAGFDTSVCWPPVGSRSKRRQRTGGNSPQQGQAPPLSSTGQCAGRGSTPRDLPSCQLRRKQIEVPRPRVGLVLSRWSALLLHQPAQPTSRSEEHTSELQSRGHIVCRLLLEKKKQDTELKA